MEALERALERESRRLSKKVLDPVVVTSPSDIQKVLAEFDPSKSANSVSPINATIQAINPDSNRPMTYNVSSSTTSRSKRDILMDGFEIIKRRSAISKSTTEQTTINGVDVSPPTLNEVSSIPWIDKLIRQWMGAERNGLTIFWRLSDGYEYKYDIYAHRLTRAKQ